MVDLVITYVNNNDEVWKKTLFDYCFSHNKRSYVVKMYNQRYSGVEWLKYQLKLVKKNMPFVRKVFLVVSNVEQVEHLTLDKNIEIVTHNKFIPYDKIPTFNSTTIEMYLPLIKDLGERFIYANDDMLPIKPLNESDFFNNDKIKIKFYNEEHKWSNNQFRYQCYNSDSLVKDTLRMKKDNTFLRPYHSMTPMIKSHCLELYRATQDKIKKHTTSFRTEYNYNQYIYPLYEHYKYGTLPTTLDFLYTELDTPIDMNKDIICVNAEKNKDITNEFIKEIEKICE